MEAALAAGEKGLEELYAKLKPFVEAHANKMFSDLIDESMKLIETKLAAKHSMFTGIELRGTEVALTIISKAIGQQPPASAPTVGPTTTTQPK